MTLPDPAPSAKAPAPFIRAPARALAIALAIAVLIACILLWRQAGDPPPIRIGVLHSQTGTMAVSEQPLIAAVELAVDEINAAGGLLGRRIEAVVADGRSDPAVFAAEAERLIDREHVAVLFGCWTSACRQAVKPVIEARRHLLFYPVQYEGMEQSPHILYTGAAPNQQILPGARWALQTFGKRVYLLGSDYVFPRTANRILRDLIEANGGQVLAERYLPLGAADFAPVIADLHHHRPDIVLSTINGDSNGAFFDALVAAQLHEQPLMSFSAAEPEMHRWGGGRLTRHYGTWSYFQSLVSESNTRFVQQFRQRLGPEAVTSDPIKAAYNGVLLWADTVRTVRSAETVRVNGNSLLRASRADPGGIVAVDAASRHLWKRVRIGQVMPDGQFHELYASQSLIRPTPWPSYRSREAWRQLTGGVP